MELSERNLKTLHDEGYKSVYEIFDDPNTAYPSHSHETEHAIIITEGSMEVVIDEETRTLTTGDYLKIPKDTEHTVKVGSNGCKYVVGE